MRQALIEKENDKKEAEVATRSVVGRLGGIVKGLWGDPKELTLAERCAEEEKDRKERERQLKEEK